MLMTPRRARIYRLLAEELAGAPHQRFDAEMVYRALDAMNERVALSTIQSILRDFVKCGLVARHERVGGRAAYVLTNQRAPGENSMR